MKPFRCLKCNNHLGATNGVVLIWKGRTWERKTKVICHFCFEVRFWYPASDEKVEQDAPIWKALD